MNTSFVANNLNNMTPQWQQITSLCQFFEKIRFLEMIILRYFCNFFFFHERFRSFKEGASEATARSQEAKRTPVWIGLTAHLKSPGTQTEW